MRYYLKPLHQYRHHINKQVDIGRAQPTWKYRAPPLYGSFTRVMNGRYRKIIDTRIPTNPGPGGGGRQTDPGETTNNPQGSLCGAETAGRTNVDDGRGYMTISPPYPHMHFRNRARRILFI